MAVYIKDVLDILKDGEAAGLAYSDEQKVEFLLAGLEKNYEYFSYLSNMQANDKSKTSTEVIKDLI